LNRTNSSQLNDSDLYFNMQNNKSNKRLNVFTLIAFIAILSGQLLPTFGSELGFAGNWIPFIFSGLVLLFLALILLIYGFKSNLFSRFFIITYLIVLPIIALWGTIISPYSVDIEGYADYFRFFVGASAFIVGYAGWQKKWINSSILITTIIFGLLLNVILYIKFLNNPWNELAQLYSTRTMGVGKFPGNWNYPYNFTVFAAFTCIFGFMYSFIKTKKTQRLIALFIGITGGYLVIVAQSRSALIATIITLVFSVLLLAFKSLWENSGGNFIKSVFIAVTSIFLLVFTYYYIFQLKTDRFSYYQTLLSEADDGSLGQTRLSQTDKFFRILGDNPGSIVWGFGPSRDFPVWIENIFIYFQRYGLIGITLMILIPLILTALIAFKMYLKSSQKHIQFVGLGTVLFCCFIAINSLTNNIFFHYRFMVLFYVLLGVFWSYYDQFRKQNQYKEII